MFTSNEWAILEQIDFFELKKSVNEKVIQKLNELKKLIQTSKIHQSFDYPIEMDATLGKISKGENYKGLPYLILDYPRVFSQQGIFAFRTMFWWGKGYFFTLHLSGKYIDFYKNILIERFDFFQEKGYYFYQEQQDEWIHEVVLPHFSAFKDVSFDDFEKRLEQKTFIKIAKKLDIKNSEELLLTGLQFYQDVFSSLIRDNI